MMILQLLSGGHIILILAVVLLLFGGKKIPELMKGLGQGVKEFKDASKSDKDQAVAFITQVMSTPPSWATGLPVACEAKYGESYGEC